jgi:hypothetical protein
MEELKEHLMSSGVSGYVHPILNKFNHIGRVGGRKKNPVEKCIYLTMYYLFYYKKH